MDFIICRLYDRSLALDSNPGSYLLAHFDRQHTPVHDEGCAITLVINRFTFKSLARLQCVGKPNNHLGICTRALKNPGRLADDRGRVVTR